MSFVIELMERGWLPDWLVRCGIRAVVRERLVEERKPDCEAECKQLMKFVSELRTAPVAVETAAANEQHYEVPAEFYLNVLGPNLKYSSCYFPRGDESLEVGEELMLALTCERAELSDGMQILELGCGWGSLTLWMAKHYPNSQITAISNSGSQRELIMAQAAARGLKNVEVLTADINEFSIETRFDRVVSVEMFEHMRNYGTLLQRVAGFLKPHGKLFVHIFCHRKYAYPYTTDGTTNWLGRYFFTGGTMPSDHLLLYFADNFSIEHHWRVSGRHYARTAWLWYQAMRDRRPQIMEALEGIYGRKEAHRWFIRWKVFFLSCYELFGFRGGEEWFVGHYRFTRR